MDYTSLVIILAIVIYVIVEYRRREQQHREALSYLKKGQKPPEEVKVVEGWTLFTAGGMVILLLAVTAYLALLAVTAHGNYARPLVVMTGIGIILAAAVGLMFIRNLSIYTRARNRRKES
jgi:hypothetical protein